MSICINWAQQVKTGSVYYTPPSSALPLDPPLSLIAMASRGMNRLLPVLLLAAVAKFFSSTAQSGFVMSGSSSSSRTSKVQMRGFKDDFYAWKETLSSEDQALLLKQAQNEFNKKFRSSDDFKASVAEDKIESFGKVLQKFFDTEREDSKKDAAAKIPDYDYLVKKAGQVGYDFSLKPAIVEVDRDADRRWSFATDKMKLAEDKGETFSDSAPLEERIF